MASAKAVEENERNGERKKEVKRIKKLPKKKNESFICVAIMSFRQNILIFIRPCDDPVTSPFFYNIFIYYKYIKLEYI